MNDAEAKRRLNEYLACEFGYADTDLDRVSPDWPFVPLCQNDAQRRLTGVLTADRDSPSRGIVASEQARLLRAQRLWLRVGKSCLLLIPGAGATVGLEHTLQALRPPMAVSSSFMLYHGSPIRTSPSCCKPLSGRGLRLSLGPSLATSWPPAANRQWRSPACVAQNPAARAACAAVRFWLTPSVARAAELGASVRDTHTGAVAFVQRFDSALRLNVHTHVLALDGVYVRESNSDSAELVFHPLPQPSAEQVADVARRSAERIRKILQSHGYQLDPELGEVDVLAAGDDTEPTARSACYGAAAQGLDLLGQRAGKPSLRLVDPTKARPDEPAAIVQGINVHAKVAIAAEDRSRLERLCRYLGRPPIAQQRLTRLGDGRLRYQFKKAWRDGTQAILLEPLDLIARIVAMIPAPGFNMVRYFGLLSSHCALRAEIVPKHAPRSVDALADIERHQLTLIRHYSCRIRALSGFSGRLSARKFHRR